ncbi:hypothetical protein NS365_01735 [Aureimonas ureilytica]|uniref:Uncharacterized protein n=1 Tax=Aureimonas ureilytica TaxID=401562 RepID=A0A175RWC2_9HYPH|nr:hypothetical protein NS365_01735 [Aureimonas ureilytica]
MHGWRLGRQRFMPARPTDASVKDGQGIRARTRDTNGWPQGFSNESRGGVCAGTTRETIASRANLYSKHVIRRGSTWQMAKAEANVAASINAHISYKIHSTQVLAGAGHSLSGALAH